MKLIALSYKYTNIHGATCLQLYLTSLVMSSPYVWQPNHKRSLSLSHAYNHSGSQSIYIGLTVVCLPDCLTACLSVCLSLGLSHTRHHQTVILID